jgi:hypothetical protein
MGREQIALPCPPGASFVFSLPEGYPVSEMPVWRLEGQVKTARVAHDIVRSALEGSFASFCDPRPLYVIYSASKSAGIWQEEPGPVLYRWITWYDVLQRLTRGAA